MKYIFIFSLSIVLLLGESVFGQSKVADKGQSIIIVVIRKEDSKPKTRSVIPQICKGEYNRTENKITIWPLINDGIITIEIINSNDCIVLVGNFNPLEQSSISIVLPEKFIDEHRIEINTEHFRGIGYFN